MSRTGNVLEMLRLLHSHRVISKSKIAEILDVNIRNVYEYKLELEKAGYTVLTQRGQYGGYYLEERNILKIPYLTETEQLALYDLHKIMHLDHSNIGSNATFDALTKICASFKTGDIESEIGIVHTKSILDSKTRLDEIYTMLRYAIVKRYPVYMKYASVSNFDVETSELSKRKFNPYDLVRVDRNWYCIMYDFKSIKWKPYKLDRIREIELHPEEYWYDQVYDLGKLVDDHGLKNTGIEVRLKLKIGKNYMLALKENPVGLNVTYEEHDDYMIYEFILKMGSNCTVLEPDIIKKRIDDKITEMYNNINR